LRPVRQGEAKGVGQRREYGPCRPVWRGGCAL